MIKQLFHRIADASLSIVSALAAPGITGWTCPEFTADGKYKIKVRVVDGELIADIVSTGLQLIIR